MDTSFQCYEQFAQFYQTAKGWIFDDIKITLNNWFGANMSAVLGGILDKIAGTNQISIESNNDKVLEILKKNGFLSGYGYQSIIDANNTTVPFLKLKSNESRYFHFYVTNELLGKTAFPAMSPQLRRKISESIYEIFVNAQMHSGTDYIYSCGQFYPTKHKIEFTIVDTGIGFKNKINSSFGVHMNAVQAIKWATTEGHSTKEDVPGGIGLALLKEFIKMNNGKFQIVSDNGFFETTAQSENARFLSFPFPGTIVNMQFRTDDTNSYQLASQVNLNDIL